MRTAVEASFLGAALLASAFACLAQARLPDADRRAENTEQRSEPRIGFGSTVFDFGKVKPGEVVKHLFVLTNTGSATLEITDVTPSCGCTTAGAWDRRIQPGKTGAIPLQFNSGGFSGMVSKSATVTCNDPRQTNVVLELTGTVWRPIEVTPAMTLFNLPGETQTNQTKVVRILSNLDEPITLSDLQCTNAAFRVELKTVRAGKEFELHITAVPPFAFPSVLATISFRTSSAQVPVINAAAYLMLQPAVSTTPQQIVLPRGPLARGATASVTINNCGTNALVLSDARTDAAGVAIRIQEPEPGRRFTLVASFPAGFQIQPDQKVEVTVKSNHPKFPIIRVQVFESEPAAASVQPPAPTVAQSLSPSVRAVPTRVAASTKMTTVGP